MRALLNFARLEDASARALGAGLADLGIEVAATASYRKEDPRRLGPHVRGYWWRDYRPESASDAWGDLRPESMLTAEEILAILPATERPAPHTGGSIEAYWRLRGDLVRAERMLDEVAPDVILSLDHPENSLDYLLLRLAQQRGIPVLLNRIGPTPRSRLVMSDPFAPAVGIDGTVAAGVIPCRDDLPQEVAGRSAAAAIRAARLRGADDWRWGGTQAPDIASESVGQRFTRRLAARSRRLRLRRVERPPVTGRRFVARLAADLASASSTVRPERGHDDCLLMLHYQPEMTTLTLGGWSVNQLEAAKVLADGLPQGWRLFVREHPMTLSASMSRASASFRPQGFYDRIARMPRTHVMPVASAAPIDIRSARVVVTSTGTVGFEALAIGIPVLHLGLAPYTNFPGTHWLAAPRASEVEPACRRLATLDRSVIIEGFDRCSEALESVAFHPADGTFTSQNAEVMLRGARSWLDRS